MKAALKKLSQADENPCVSRRILMATHGTLFDEGVAKILTQRTDLEVWETWKANAYLLAQAAAEICPDVLLLFDTDPERQKGLVGLLDSFPVLQRLQVVILLLDCYSLHVYSKKHWLQMDGRTFFRVIYGKPLGTLDSDKSNPNRLAPAFIEMWTGNLLDSLETRLLAGA